METFGKQKGGFALYARAMHLSTNGLHSTLVLSQVAVAFLRENVTATMNYSLVIFCLFCLIYLSIINISPVSDVDGVYLITSGILDEPMVNSSYLQYLCTKKIVLPSFAIGPLQ